MKSTKKRSKLSAIFDIRYIFYDFVKLTGVIPILLIFRLKTYCFNKKKKEEMRKNIAFNEKRIANAKCLNEGLKDIEAIETPVLKDGCKHVYHQYTIKIKDGKRDELSDYLIENGIGNGIYYPIPLYNQVLYKELGYDQALPVTDEIVEEVLSLPIHAKLTQEDLDYIIKTIKEF